MNDRQFEINMTIVKILASLVESQDHMSSYNVGLVNKLHALVLRGDDIDGTKR